MWWKTEGAQRGGITCDGTTMVANRGGTMCCGATWWQTKVANQGWLAGGTTMVAQGGGTSNRSITHEQVAERSVVSGVGRAQCWINCSALVWS